MIKQLSIYLGHFISNYNRITAISAQHGAGQGQAEGYRDHTISLFYSLWKPEITKPFPLTTFYLKHGRISPGYGLRDARLIGP